MKSQLFFYIAFFLCVSSCSILNKVTSEYWDENDYKTIWENHQKIYIYADGNFIVTNEQLSDSKEVVLLYLKEDEKKLKTGTGKLPVDIIENKLSELTPFNPTKAAVRPPCCPVRDRNGVLLYYAYADDCPYPCKKPLRRLSSGTVVQLNCCPPTFEGYFELR